MISTDEITIEKGNVRQDVNDEKIEELAQSIERIGLINPISVSEFQGKFKLVAGQRRFLAYEKLGKKKIPSIVFNAENEHLFGIQVSENIQREQISPIDEGRAFVAAIRNQGITQKELAELISKSESYVADRIATQKYFPNLLRALKLKKISFSVAREFAKIKSRNDLDKFLEYAETGGINPKMARQWIKQYKRSNEPVERIELEDRPEHGPGSGTGSNLTTGCHGCKQTISMMDAKHLILCPECFKLINEA